MPPEFSVITPSFGQLNWLRLAAASVADQEGVIVEHIIQDAGTEGARELFEKIVQAPAHDYYQRRLFIEKDDGMYDAINRGLKRACGEICAYLNCDEQYLPGALARVVAAFRANPHVNLALAGSVVVDGSGKYVCSRPALKPSLRQLRNRRMYNLTCSIFFRANVIKEQRLFFDSALRVVGDLDWLRRVIEAGNTPLILDFITSAFSDIGTNLALTREASLEAAKIDHRGKIWRQISSKAFTASHRLDRLRSGHYRQRPFDYAIYTPDHLKERKIFHVERPTGIWRNRL